VALSPALKRLQREAVLFPLSLADVKAHGTCTSTSLYVMARGEGGARESWKLCRIGTQPVNQQCAACSWQGILFPLVISLAR
jgi:hypothetical protein